MRREDALQLVRRLEQAVNTHDVACLTDFYADDAVMVSPMFPQVSGRAAIARNWETTFSQFPDWTARVHDVLVDEDRVAFIGVAGATDRNGWFGQAPTGERIEYRAMIVLTLRDGKIIRDERLYDLTAILNRLEKSRIDKELRMAAEVQRTLLAKARHATSFCEAVGDSIACRAIGGDFFEILDLPSGEVGIALGDVAGKGPASALLAAMIQGMFSVEARSESSPAKVLARLNCSLAQRRLEPRFATLVYGILSRDGRLLYSLAGHNPPILMTRDRLHRLATGGPVLGAFSESVFPEEAVQLREGDSVIMFSDGVTEARDAHGEEFGEERLIGWLTANGAQPPADVLNGILKRVRDFVQGSPPTDDVTVTVTRFGAS